MTEAVPADSPKQRTLGPLIVALGAVLLVVGGAGWAAVKLELIELPTTGGDASSVATPPAETPGTLLTLEPLVVSLPDADSTSWRTPRLMVSVSVEVGDLRDAEAERVQLVLRSAFTMRLRQIPLGTLTGADGLTVAREALLESAEDALGAERIKSILITDYLLT